jgi:hypothetical protein
MISMRVFQAASFAGGVEQHVEFGGELFGAFAWDAEGFGLLCEAQGPDLQRAGWRRPDGGRVEHCRPEVIGEWLLELHGDVFCGHGHPVSLR